MCKFTIFMVRRSPPVKPLIMVSGIFLLLIVIVLLMLFFIAVFGTLFTVSFKRPELVKAGGGILIMQEYICSPGSGRLHAAKVRNILLVERNITGGSNAIRIIKRKDQREHPETITQCGVLLTENEIGDPRQLPAGLKATIVPAGNYVCMRIQKIRLTLPWLRLYTLRNTLNNFCLENSLRYENQILEIDDKQKKEIVYLMPFEFKILNNAGSP